MALSLRSRCIVVVNIILSWVVSMILYIPLVAGLPQGYFLSICPSPKQSYDNVCCALHICCYYGDKMLWLHPRHPAWSLIQIVATVATATIGLTLWCLCYLFRKIPLIDLATMIYIDGELMGEVSLEKASVSATFPDRVLAFQVHGTFTTSTKDIECQWIDSKFTYSLSIDPIIDRLIAVAKYLVGLPAPMMPLTPLHTDYRIDCQFLDVHATTFTFPAALYMYLKNLVMSSSANKAFLSSNPEAEDDAPFFYTLGQIILYHGERLVADNLQRAFSGILEHNIHCLARVGGFAIALPAYLWQGVGDDARFDIMWSKGEQGWVVKKDSIVFELAGCNMAPLCN